MIISLNVLIVLNQGGENNKNIKLALLGIASAERIDCHTVSLFFFSSDDQLSIRNAPGDALSCCSICNKNHRSAS